MYQPTPTLHDALSALESLKSIKWPEGDNAGEPINSAYVYDALSSGDQRRVDIAEDVVGRYVRKPGDYGDEPNKRSITELNKKGFYADLGPAQYDQDRLVGSVEITSEITLDLSDPAPRRENDWGGYALSDRMP